jgi:glycosyltransferase involved in cell wall biosynthesis
METKKAIRIVYYSPHPTHDIVTEVGYATHQRETIEALRQLGAEVIPVIMGGTTPQDIPYTEGKAVEAGGLKKWLKKWIPRYVWVSIKDAALLIHDRKAGNILDNTLKTHSADLLYERSEYLQDSGIAPAKKHRIPYFIEVNAPFVQEMSQMEGRSIWTGWGHFKEKRKYAAADAIFVVSTVLKEFLINRYGVSPQKIHVSPNRINVEHFMAQAHAPLPIPLHAAPPDVPLIGFVGSILPHHHVEDLIDAFFDCMKGGLQARLLIVGGGSLLESLIEKVSHSPYAPLVQFTGKIPHNLIPAYLQQMTITVMPGSNWYGSPIKIFEYGILGKCVIAPDNGPVNDVMTHLEDGLLIAPGTEALANALRFALTHPAECQQMGARFQQKIQKTYTWRHAGEMIWKEWTSLHTTA